MRIKSQARRGSFQSRPPSRLARWSVGFAPEAASLSEGLRAAAACASLAAVAVLLHDSNLAWAAVMAFWACLVDPGGPTRVRAWTLAIFTIAATVVAMLSAGMASFGVGPATATLLIVSMICSYLRVYGAAGSTLANLLVVVAVVTIARPASSPGGLLEFGGLCLGGCLWAALLSLTVWRIHPFAAARKALGQVYRHLAQMVVDLAAVSHAPGGAPDWAHHAERHRRGVRQAIEEARRLTAQAMGGRSAEDGAGAMGDRLTAALGAAEVLFAYMIALSDTLEREGLGGSDQRRRTLRLIGQTASVFHRIARQIEATDGEAAPLRLAIARLRRGADGVPAAVGRLMQEFAAEAQRLADEDAPGPAGPAPPSGAGARASLLRRLAAPLKANLNWRSIYLRHALRVAVCVTAAFLIGSLFQIPYGYWMTTTVVLIQQPYLSNSWVRAIERVVGGVLGGGLAALLGLMFHSEGALLVLIFPLAIASMAFRAVNYSLYVFFLTPLFVLILDLTHPGTREVAVAGIRALNTVAGGAIALAGSMLLWPGSEGDRLKSDVADAIERNGRFAGLALDPAADDEPRQAARREAGMASNKAEESRRRAALEIWRGRGRGDAAANVLAALRRLAGTAMTLWLQGRLQDGPHPGAAIAAWCESASAALAAALRGGGPIADPPPPPIAGPAEPVVEEIQDLYRVARAFNRS